MENKKTIFLTGASGHMGQAGLKHLLQRRDRFNIVLLVLPTERDKKIMSVYQNEPGVSIVWGDLTRYTDVLECVIGADVVLHVGGMVSPLADYYPELTSKVNIGAVKHIIQAIKAQPDPDRIKLVFIGSVAQTGDRNPPIHWGRVGDPIKISAYDNYALTKTIAEREVIESGLKYWVSLRQTGIAYGTIASALDPIMFHQPLNGVFEWITVGDSGRLLANVCEEDVPELFWRAIYNIGGGSRFRTTNYAFLQRSFAALGIEDFRSFLEPCWFALKNFHGQWYEDSDLLDSYLHFRTESLDDFFADLKRNAPLPMRWSKLAPPWIVKKLVFEPVANREMGTLHWIKHGEDDKIAAYFGSRETWEAVPDWGNFDLTVPSDKPQRLDHGYDETKPRLELDITDMTQAAAFRGGQCLSKGMTQGDLSTRLKWRCAFGHEFEASPTLVLFGGHWCPACLTAACAPDEIATRNPFFAQVMPR
jgi:nucleoside-diphosphate-sugar epimerase